MSNAAIGLTILIVSGTTFFVNNLHDDSDFNSERKKSLQHVFNKETPPNKAVTYLKENGWSVLDIYNKQAEKYPTCLEEIDNVMSNSEQKDALNSCMGLTYFSAQEHTPNPHFFLKVLKNR